MTIEYMPANDLLIDALMRAEGGKFNTFAVADAVSLFQAGSGAKRGFGSELIGGFLLP